MRIDLGDLVTAVFDAAEAYHTDPEVVSHLATAAVMLMLRRSLRTTDHSDALAHQISEQSQKH